MEQAQILTIGTMDQAVPMLPDCGQAQVDDPQIDQASRDHQFMQTVRGGEMTFVKVQTETFLAEKKVSMRKRFLYQ